jgi:hypothetical protein
VSHLRTSARSEDRGDGPAGRWALSPFEQDLLLGSQERLKRIATMKVPAGYIAVRAREKIKPQDVKLLWAVT